MTPKKYTEYNREYHARTKFNPHRKESKQREHLKRCYNMTLEEYQTLLKNQDNKCAICKIDQKDCNKRMSVDHCHRTGKIRGLLCDGCNRGIGYLGDSIARILEAAEYLRTSTLK